MKRFLMVAIAVTCTSVRGATLPTVYPFDLAPETYPDYTRRLLPAPDWNTFHNQPQFVGVRYTMMDEPYFTGRWQAYSLSFVATNSGMATVKIENQNCDATVLVDDVSVQPMTPQELLSNGDFEGSGGWALDAGAAYTTAQAHSPTHSISLPGGNKLDASPRPAIQAGHTYQCSVWVKTSGTGPWVMQFGNWQAGGTVMWVSRPTANNDWEKFSATITPTILTNNYNQFEVSSESGGPLLYVDDFSAQELVTSSTNLVANSGFETVDPGESWTRTAGVGVYPDGYLSGHSMLVPAGNNLQTTVNVVSGQTYQATAWLSVAGRSAGQVQISAVTASLVVTNETTTNPSGLVYWPQVQLIVNPGDISTLIDTWVNHGVILHNLGGYGPGTPWVPNFGQCLVNPTTFAALTNQMGNRFTGGDIGEQDARFANIFESCYEPFSLSNRFLNFKTASRYQGQCADDLGNVTSLLIELWLWHYPVKEGSVTISGVETQPKIGVANSQVQYAFVRGAGKQYGVPWWGNVSIFSSDWRNNGINYKSYPVTPTNGISLNLMRRLVFSHYLYGCRILSFEQGDRTDQNTVSPIGTIHEAMVQTINRYGVPGVMHAPVGLLMDFWSGWMPAQYNRGNYYTWNGLDYEAGDFLTHNVFSMLYPDYEANGFFQNETGGMCRTPYGDMADALLSDVTAPILNRYGVVIAAGNLSSANTELRDKVENFLANGGNFIVTGENARRIWPEFGIGPGQTTIPAGGAVVWSDATTNTESYAGVVYSVNTAALPAGYTVLANYAGAPVVLDIPRGAGTITLLLSPYGLNQNALTSVHPNWTGYNVALPKPYVLMGHAQKILGDRLAGQRLFSVDNTNLGYITCRQAAGDYLVGILNASLASQSFNISSFIGSITNLTELSLGASVTNQLGYWPLGSENNNGGLSDSSHVFGGDIRLFRVQVAETNTFRLLTTNAPPARPFNRMVTVPALCNLKDTLQQWFTFFDYFDGVKLDWTSVRNADLTVGNSSLLYEPMQWIARHQVRFVTDFSSGFLTGDLTLVTNAAGYAQSVARFDAAINKLALLGRANDIIITAEEATPDSFRAGVSALCSNAATRSINVHFKHRTTSWTPDVAATLNFISSVGAGNLKFAADAGELAQASNQLGLILITPTGGAMDFSPVRSRNGIQILDAGYSAWDSVYRDAGAAWVTNGPATLAGAPLSLPTETFWLTSKNNAQRFWIARDTVDLPDTLRRQTNFWRYFGGVKVDYKYLAYRDAAQCATEGKWLQDRRVQLVVDFSSDLINYPGMTLADSTTPGDGVSANYNRSIATINDVFDKMQLMGVTNAIIRPTMPNTASNLTAYRLICSNAWARGHIILHMQHCVGNWITRSDGSYDTPANVASLIDAIAAPAGNLKMAVNGCHISNLSSAISAAGSRLGLILLGYPAATRVDVDVHGAARLGMATSAIAGRSEPLIMDSEYMDWNDTAQDLPYLGWSASTPPSGPPVTPSNLVATAGSGLVALNWNGSDAATSYNVKRSLSSGGAHATIASPTGVGFVDIGLANGATYYYVVSATNAFGESADSAEVSATPTANLGLLINPSFELPGLGKITTGFAAVTGWRNSGTTYTDTGIEPTTSHSGSYHAYCRGGDGGAFQIANYQINAGDVLTLTWWATTTGGAGVTTQNVRLVRAPATNTTFAGTTTLASTNNSLGSSIYDYQPYTLSYVATPADAGNYIGVSFANVSITGNWGGWDDFNLTVTPAFQAWQWANFGSTNCASCGGDADFDGDGMSNTNEFLAGTNPTNSASAFRILSIAAEGGDVDIGWQSVPGKTNFVQANADDISGPIAINGTQTNYTDFGGLTNPGPRFYRIRLTP